ncbi:uncharacterized protein N0V89_011536 [Didymosphaeria variabile]|uniref:Nephrocystin 3-like N-terminal domain-containing protein n=1 Tax=Didymosphaeria variabile TaxID=1932322 RepID=A0A9W9C4V0_9PLEO|nr:uncharacterized protein N0V89_011536 [Didymosphaeria variabile]KAJ4345406.1 hypothetical protein N0V89_011536 [Didymosphaeria variabile]
MDPLAGLSLACNIMQVIQFSAETLRVFKRLNEGVSPDLYVETNRKSLMTATEKLKSTLSTPSVLKLVPRDATLLHVCNEIVTVSDALHKQVQKFFPAKGDSKTTILRKSVAYQFKYKSTTGKLSQQLDRLQNRMESEILIDLRQFLMEDQYEVLGRFQSLDNDLRNFHANLITGQTRLEGLVDQQSGQIKEAIRDESQKTRERIVQSAQETKDLIDTTESERISDVACQQFLESFRFPEMNARRNTIEISHPDTFQWIFQEPGKTKGSDDDVPKWSSFSTWLRDGTGTYWISGKAGAGKSTLMKFLLEDPTTRQILSNNRSNTMIISAFIWSLGASTQKSLVGVLCTLLYDFFAQNRDICRQMMKERQSDFRLKRESSDWSLQELELLFSSVVGNCPCSLCIFIDGLDEIDRTKSTEVTSLMKWLESIRALRTVQLCVSSRPEPVFENRLRQYPHLQVQDLTAKDIKHYVSSIVCSLDFGFEGSSQDIQKLVETIVRRAEGVFLWAHLVVEHIRTDTEYSSNWKTLVQRVNELPSGLHSMYKLMWERHNSDSEVHRAETASFLNVLLEALRLGGYICAIFIFAGFRAQLQDLLQELPSEELYRVKKKLLICMCIVKRTIMIRDASDFMIELLHCVRPQDLSNNTPFLLHGSLVGHLFAYAKSLLEISLPRRFQVSQNGPRFIRLLLQKCGGIEALSKWRVLVMLPHYVARPTSREPATVLTNFHAVLDFSGGGNSSPHATLVESSMLEVFLAEESPLQKFLIHTRGLSPAGRTCLQKIVMIVQFVTKQNDITGEYYISGFDSKPIYHMDTTLDLGELFIMKYSSGTYSNEILDEPKLNSEQTLDFLVAKGYLTRDCVNPVNPLRALLDEDVLAPEKSPQFSDIDWSFEIDCERLEHASRDVVEKERKAGNPKAIAPCKGGMRFSEATEQWQDTWESLMEELHIEDWDYEG